MRRIVIVMLFVACHRGAIVQSQEFCFRAWFPAAPIESDDDRVLDSGIRLRARNFRYSDAQGGLIVTTVKFPARAVTAKYLPVYFKSAIASHAKKLNGKVLSVKEATFRDMPARWFEVEWSQGGARWRSRNVIVYDRGCSFTAGVIYGANSVAPPERAEKFFRELQFDKNCIRRNP